MKTIETENFIINFANKKNSIIKENISIKTPLNIIFTNPIDRLIKNKKIDYLIFANQVHKTDSLIVENSIDLSTQKQFYQDADFLITELKNVALGILTADCLPIFIYDSLNHIAIAIHAGWRSSVDLILEKAILLLKREYNSNLKFLKLYFGPCAKQCCYSVKNDVITRINHTIFNQKSLIVKDNLIYFDNVQFNYNIANFYKIPIQNIDISHSVCTICNNNYCSYRKNTKSKERQISFISLK